MPGCSAMSSWGVTVPLVLLALLAVSSSAQDTIQIKTIEVRDQRHGLGMAVLFMDEITADAIFAGRKTELIPIDTRWMTTSTNNARQAFASVAGLNIWESDAAGLQLGIGGRGLSPDRTSNFTTRQNGYDISADPLGYPESYYTPPFDLVERIEVVRGGASLRYGTQFGGVINFAFRPPVHTAALASRVAVSGGSFGFASALVDISGTLDQTQYRAFYQGKRGDGWRPNSDFTMHTAHALVDHHLSDRMHVRAEYTGMHYVAHQPGGLTDRQFEQDPRTSIRARNWFGVDWNLFAVRLDYLLGETTTLRSQWFGNISQRTSLGNLERITMVDLGNNRTMIDGRFRNIGTETTISWDAEPLGLPWSFVSGVRLFQGTTTQQQGDASNGSGPDFAFLHPNNLEVSDYTFPNSNAAVFSEGILRLGGGWSVVPGIRLEHIVTRANGWYRQTVRDLAGNVVADTTINEDRSRSRTILLAGISLSWKPTDAIEYYANAVQNYRSITFSDLRLDNPNLVIDPNIGDERGATFDVGARGRLTPWLAFDVSGFYLLYNDRIGEILRSDLAPLYLPYRYRSNIADAYTAGIESMIDFDLSDAAGWEPSAPHVHLLLNASYLTGQYVSSQNTAVDGKRVEFVPAYTIRTGVRTWWQGASASVMVHAVGDHYTDASNTTATATAVTGLIPSYMVADVTIGYRWKSVELSATINNALDHSYFTRRAVSYPGPGIIPAEARSIVLTMSWNGDIITEAP